MAGRGGATARLVVLCGLLLGLFLMHGSPASAAGGCHAPAHGRHASHAESANQAESAADADTTMPGASAERGATAEPADGPRAAAPGHRSAFGQSCVSTAARGSGLPLAGPLPAPVGVAAAVAGAGAQGGRAAGDGCRAPPGGRELLIRVCVART